MAVKGHKGSYLLLRSPELAYIAKPNIAMPSYCASDCPLLQRRPEGGTVCWLTTVAPDGVKLTHTRGERVVRSWICRSRAVWSRELVAWRDLCPLGWKYDSPGSHIRTLAMALASAGAPLSSLQLRYAAAGGDVLTPRHLVALADVRGADPQALASDWGAWLRQMPAVPGKVKAS